MFICILYFDILINLEEAMPLPNLLSFCWEIKLTPMKEHNGYIFENSFRANAILMLAISVSVDIVDLFCWFRGSYVTAIQNSKGVFTYYCIRMHSLIFPAYVSGVFQAWSLFTKFHFVYKHDFLHDSISRRNYPTKSLSVEIENVTFNHKDGMIAKS